MAIRYYDAALVDKIKGWVLDPKLLILSPSDVTRLFQITADQLDDKPITLPLIAISRDSSLNILNTNKKSPTYNGIITDNDGNNSQMLNAVPIQISYQLDIYTRYFAEADEYFRNFVFNIINDPKLDIEIPYNDSKINHRSSIRLESQVSDNSDIPERLIQGQFSRITLRLSIDDAFLFSVPFKSNWKIEPGINLKIKQGE